KLRLPPILEAGDEIGHRPFDVTRAMHVFDTAVDRFEIAVGLATDAQHRRPVRKPSYLDDTFGTDKSIVATDETSAFPCGGDAVDAVFVHPQHVRLIFVVGAKDELGLTVVDLSDDPDGAAFVVEVVAHVKLMRAVVVQVAGAKLDPLELADGARVEQRL